MAATHLELQTKELAHANGAWCVAWLPDEKQDILFSGGADGTIKQWKVTENQQYFDNKGGVLTTLGLIPRGEKSISISPITDMKCVAVSSSNDTYLLSTVSVDGMVRVYAIDVSESKTSAPLSSSMSSDHTHNHANDAIGIDEYKQFDMNERHKVFLCDADGKKSPAQYLEQYGGCWASDINADCSVVATGDQFGQIYLWSLYNESDNTKKIPTVLQAQVPMVKFQPKTKTPSTSTSATENGEQKLLRGTHAMVRGVTFNRRHRNLLAVSCQDSQRVQVFDIEKGVSVFCRKLTFNEIRDCVWLDDAQQRFVCVACDDAFVHVYDTTQNKKAAKHAKKALVASLASHKSCVTSVDVGKDNQYVASGSMDNTVKLWDLTAKNDEKLMETHHDHSDQVWSVRFNANKDKLATIGDDGYLCIYSMKNN